MTIAEQTVERGEARLTIQVAVEEMRPFLERAAARLSRGKPIPGFRPGKAPLAMVMLQLGAMAVHEEALQEIIADAYWKALQQEKLTSVGPPEVQVEKIAPGNPLVFRARAALLPEITFMSWREIAATRAQIVVTDAEVDKVVHELRAMRASETLVSRAAQTGDRVEVDFEVTRDNAVIEGGSGKKYPLILGSGAMIPGFEDQIIGLSAGEKKTFSLAFPEHYAKQSLAGKQADFSVTMIAVYERALPEQNDAWAHDIAKVSLQELREQLRANILSEKRRNEERRLEQEVIEKLLQRATFSDISGALIDAETRTMAHELKSDILARGMQWEQYLQGIKKTEEQLRQEMRPLGEKRVKSALVLRALARELGVTVSGQEVDRELDRQRREYRDDQEAQKNLARLEYRNYVQSHLQNAKVLSAVFRELKL